MTHLKYLAGAIALVTLNACNIDVASLLRGGSNGATAGPTQSGTSSISQRTDVRITMAKDPTITVVSYYSSAKFDLFTGQETMLDDGGHVEFLFLNGLSTEKDGLSLFGRKYVAKKAVMQFQDAGQVPLDQVKEAPEYGWSVAAPDQRGSIKLTPGKVTLLRMRLNDERDQFFAKLLVKDFSQSMVTFDYAIQTATGSRQLI